MIKCVDENAVLRLRAGQLSAEEAATLEGHFSRCDKCSALRDEIDTMTNRLALQEEEEEEDIASDVMTLIRLGRANRAARQEPSFWQRIVESWRTFLLVPATAVATLLVAALIYPQWSGDSQFRARGDNISTDRWVSIRAFHATERGMEPLREEITKADAVAFAYTNRATKEHYRYLMVLGVDEAGEVYWYYPAHVDEASNPESVAIEVSDKPKLLPDQVRHKFSARSVRIFGLFSTEAFDVKQVEQVVAKDLERAERLEQLTRLSLPAGQHVLPFVVRGETD